MFGVDSSELAVVAILALIFIGPKDLPRVLRTVGYWVGRMRGMARHFTSGIENMVREAELEEMEKKWREENERIMQLHPANADYPEPGQPDAMPPVAEAQEPPPPLSSADRSPSPGNPGEDELPPEKRPLP
jgi:sec-independent protein translocase protein TatB